MGSRPNARALGGAAARPGGAGDEDHVGKEEINVNRTLGLVLSYAKRYKPYLAIAILSMILLVGLELITPLITRSLIAAIQNGTWDKVAGRFVLQLVGALLGIYFLRGLLSFASNYSAHIGGWNVVTDTRQHIYEHLQRLSLSFYEDQQTGQLMSRVVNDSDMFERLIAHAVPGVMVNILTLIGVSAVLGFMEWRLMLLLLIPVPFIILGMQGFARYVRPCVP